MNKTMSSKNTNAISTKSAKLRLESKTIELEKQLARIEELRSLMNLPDQFSSASTGSLRSIQRDRQPIKSKSMSIERWIESRGSGKTTNLSKDLILYHHRRFRDSLEESMSIINAIKARKSTAKNYGLDDLNRLRAIQERLNAELTANIEIIERFNIHNEFNHVVSKVKIFLDEIDAFNAKQNRAIKSKVKLYEYA
jgi:hypothetical protein